MPWHFIYNLGHSLFSMYVVAHQRVIGFILHPLTRLEFDHHPEQVPEPVEVLHLEPVLEPDKVYGQFGLFDVLQGLHAYARGLVGEVQLALVELVHVRVLGLLIVQSVFIQFPRVFIILWV